MVCDVCRYRVVLGQRYFPDVTYLAAKSCNNKKCWLYMKDIIGLEYCEHYDYVGLHDEVENDSDLYEDIGGEE